jgi:hypothetical protein
VLYKVFGLRFLRYRAWCSSYFTVHKSVESILFIHYLFYKSSSQVIFTVYRQIRWEDLIPIKLEKTWYPVYYGDKNSQVMASKIFIVSLGYMKWRLHRTEARRRTGLAVLEGEHSSYSATFVGYKRREEYLKISKK